MKNRSYTPDIPEASGISRRTVTKGIAWSLPVFALAVAAPAHAASVPVPAETYSMVLTSLLAAPAAGTAGGNQGTQANLAANQEFRVYGIVANNGPATASSFNVVVTYPQSAVPNEFTVNAPWVITSVAVNESLERWLVYMTYVGDVAAGESAPQFALATRTRVASQFPDGKSGAYEVLSRTFNADGSQSDTLSDYFYVSR